MLFDDKLKPLYPSQDRKKAQAELIMKTNPPFNDYSAWIRTDADIKTFDELQEEFDEGDFTEDWTRAQYDYALKNRKVKVYSSKPLVNGNLVTPSLMEAKAYAGSSKIHTAWMDVDDIAWLDSGQGQIAKLK